MLNFSKIIIIILKLSFKIFPEIQRPENPGFVLLPNDPTRDITRVRVHEGGSIHKVSYDIIRTVPTPHSSMILYRKNCNNN